MNGTRSRWSLVVATAIVAVAVAAVVVFGVIPYPDPPTVASSPDPMVTARLAFIADQREPCLLVVDGTGARETLGCGSRFSAYGLAWGPANTLELDGALDNGQIVVIDADTGSQTGVRPRDTTAPGEPVPQSTANDDGEVLQTGNDDGSAWVEVIAADGRLRRILELNGPRSYHLYDPRWSDDGRWVAVRDSLDRILVVDAQGTGGVRVWAEGIGAFDVR